MLRPLLLPGLALLVLIPAAAHAADRVSGPALIAAAKATPLTAIDPARAECNDRRTIAEWLRQAVGPAARRIAWRGGKCVLVIPDNPLDAGGHWCAHADILPKRGRKGGTVEVYFEAPAAGRPGAAYAFRGVAELRDGDTDYSRDTISFEFDWRQAHEPDFDDGTRICAPRE